MLRRNMDAEAHKSRDINESDPFESPAAPRSLDAHEFTVPHSVGSCAIPSLAETRVERAAATPVHMSAHDLKTDWKTFCRLAAW